MATDYELLNSTYRDFPVEEITVPSLQIMVHVLIMFRKCFLGSFQVIKVSDVFLSTTRMRFPLKQVLIGLRVQLSSCPCCECLDFVCRRQQINNFLFPLSCSFLFSSKKFSSNIQKAGKLLCAIVALLFP